MEQAELADEETLCPICLESIEPEITATISCGHAFCKPCLAKFCALKKGASSLPCPCCKRSFVDPFEPDDGNDGDSEEDVARSNQPLAQRPSLRRQGALPRIPLQADHGEGRDRTEVHEAPTWQTLQLPNYEQRPSATTHERVRNTGGRAAFARPWWQAGARRPSASASEHRELQRTLRGAVGRAQVRFCPGCNVPIQKNGGCDHMNCPCGQSFHWLMARPVRPCNHCHYDSDKGMFGWWETCPHCSTVAKVKAAAANTGATAAVTTLGVTVGSVCIPTGIALGITVAVVPAVTIGPLALVYEPVRRILGKKTNPLAMAAGAGALAAATVTALCILRTGDDSD